MIIAGVIIALLAALKIKGSQVDKLKSKLMTKDTEGKSSVIDTKREEVRKDLEELDKQHKENKESANEESSADYWKKKL